MHSADACAIKTVLKAILLSYLSTLSTNYFVVIGNHYCLMAFIMWKFEYCSFFICRQQLKLINMLGG